MRFFITLLLCLWPLTSLAEPVVYLAQNPNFCANLTGNVYYLYVHSHDDADFTSVSLNLQLGGTVASPGVIAADPNNSGVTVDAVDTSSEPYHVEFHWTPRTLEHERMAIVLFSSEPVWDSGPRTTDVVFKRPGGAEVAAPDRTTYPGWADCPICHMCFEIDGHILVPRGTSTIPFGWSFWCYGSGGGDGILASDSQGWVASWAPTSGTGNGYCFPCWVDYFPGTVELNVPMDTPIGTTSSLRLEGVHNGYHCPGWATIEVADAVPTESSTWGRIKALYQ